MGYMTTDAQRRAQAKYRASAKGKAAVARHRASYIWEGLPEAKARYRQTPKGRAAADRYLPGVLARRREQTEHIWTLKAERGCADCGYADNPRKLHFHHRPGTVKIDNVGSMRSCSWERILTEIEKCDVLCAACHARRHARLAA